MENLIKKYRPYGIAVTELSSQLWCEKQFEFRLETGVIENEQMLKGKERHKELHEEIAIIHEFEPETVADFFAMKLHNIQVGLERLDLRGMTRELPVFGRVNSLFAHGVVDELKLKDRKLSILDTKTRQKNTMPSEYQKRMTRFQLMLYNKLLCDLISGNFTSEDLLRILEIKETDKISKSLKHQIDKIGDTIEPNIKKLSKETFKLFRTLPIPENEMSIRYEFQQDRKIIGTEMFSFDDSMFLKNCSLIEEFWIGKRKAIPVTANNNWICRFCEFAETCNEKTKN